MSGQLLEVLKQNDKKAPKKKVTKEHAPKKYSTMREEALATPLPETNIGFKLLKQMGYKEGSGLGKQSDGRVDPVSVTLKRGRVGLGLGDEMFEGPPSKTPKSEEGTTSSLQDTMDQFKKMQEERFQERRVNGQLKAAVLIGLELDRQKGIPVTALYPIQFLPPEEEDEENPTNHEEQNLLAPLTREEREQSLADIITYLRHEHIYCFYCTAKYATEEEMQDHCPGENEEDHL